MSIQDIQQDPQDTSNFYLANIYQATIADPNRANISTPSSPPPFTPPNYAVWVNGLWFLSLMISITCALLATLLQQWARRYLKVTQPRYSLHRQARIRSFFAEGVEKSFLPLVVEALPTLLHLSLSLFFAGLVVFLRNVNVTIFKMALSWVCVCAAFYGYVTLVPNFRRDSPYHTPLTPLAWPICVVILRVFLLLRACLFVLPCYVLRIFYAMCFSQRCFDILWYIVGDINPSPGPDHWLRRVLRSIFMTAEEVAEKLPPEIDARAFMWTFDSLDEDHELERFFSSLPDFRSSQVVHDPLPSLAQEQKKKISETLRRFLGHALSSDLLPEAAKVQRAIMCAKALDPAEFSREYVNDLHWDIFCVFKRGPGDTDFRGIANDSGTEQTVFLHAMTTGFAARPRRRDDSWFRQVAPNALGIPETVLRDYAANGNSLSLAILIYVTRRQFTYFGHSSWPRSTFRDVLEAGSEFNVQDTLPELQHEFCTLWNQIVLKARNDNNQVIVRNILAPLLMVYIAIHQHAGYLRYYSDDPLQHVCTDDGHVHGGSQRSQHSPLARTAPHTHTALVPPSIASPGVPSSSTSAPLHIIEGSADVPSPGNFHPTQTTINGLRLPLASASVMRDINASVRTTLQPTPEPSTSLPLSSSLPADSVILPHSANFFSDSSDRPSLAFLSRVPGNMLRTGPSTFSLLLNYLI